MVFARVLNNRAKVMTEESVMEERGGFRSGKGCIEVIEKMIIHGIR